MFSRSLSVHEYVYLASIACRFSGNFQSSMTISSVNSEEACQISVSQAMKHLKPDNESEMLSAEDTFPSEATTAEVCILLMQFNACM